MPTDRNNHHEPTNPDDLPAADLLAWLHSLDQSFALDPVTKSRTLTNLMRGASATRPTTNGLAVVGADPRVRPASQHERPIGKPGQTRRSAPTGVGDRRPTFVLLASLALIVVATLVIARDDPPPPPAPRLAAPTVGCATIATPTASENPRLTPYASATPAHSTEGVVPVSIHIDRGQIDAPIEALDIVDGVLPMATKPFVVAWYPQTAGLGTGGNVVMFGHFDHWDVGPAIFFELNRLKPGDPIEVTGENGIVYTYYVAWVRLYDAAAAPLEDIIGATSVESLTLITSGGDFDYQKGQYLGRTVVRATCG